MNSVAQDSALGTIFSSQAARALSVGYSFRSRLACFMIFCLHFFACDMSSILRVLESFDMGGSISKVEQYVEEEELLQHHEIEAPSDGRGVFNELSNEF